MILRTGSQGVDVQKLQEQLNVLGESLRVNSSFDQFTERAVQRWQTKNGHQVDGIVTDALRVKIAEQAAKHAPAAPPPPPKIEGVLSGKGPWEGYGDHKFPGLQVIICAHNHAAYLSQCLASIEKATVGLDWILIIYDDGSTDHTYATATDHQTSAKRKIIKRVDKQPTIGAARNAALRCGEEFRRDYPAISFVDADDLVTPEKFTQTMPPLIKSGEKAAFTSWMVRDGYGTDATHHREKASHMCLVNGTVPLGATIFHHTVIPGHHRMFNESLEAYEDASWAMEFWKNGFAMLPLDDVTSFIHHRVPGGLKSDEHKVIFEARLSSWDIDRRRIMESEFENPKISALMLTGRNRARFALARVAVQCFLDQTWPNKELIIVNHHPEISLADGDPRIKEVKVVKNERFMLGDMRNASIENATGEWCIQWDDDDWHHPTRMARQWEVAHRVPHALTTFDWQVRCNLLDGAAFYDKMDGGQHMSIMFSRSVPQRYFSLNIREDTAFKKEFPETVSIDNAATNPHADPMQYIRFYHGRNIWDAYHVMRGSTGERQIVPGNVELSDYHAAKMKEILKLYRQQPEWEDPE